MFPMIRNLKVSTRIKTKSITKTCIRFVEKTLFNHLFRCSKVQVICETQSLGFGGEIS